MVPTRQLAVKFPLTVDASSVAILSCDVQCLLPASPITCLNLLVEPLSNIASLSVLVAPCQLDLLAELTVSINGFLAPNTRSVFILRIVLSVCSEIKIGTCTA